MQACCAHQHGPMRTYSSTPAAATAEATRAQVWRTTRAVAAAAAGAWLIVSSTGSSAPHHEQTISPGPGPDQGAQMKQPQYAVTAPGPQPTGLGVYFSEGGPMAHIAAALPALRRPFPAFGWDPFPERGHVETVGAWVARTRPRASFTRELLTAPDGATIALDWLDAECPPGGGRSQADEGEGKGGEGRSSSGTGGSNGVGGEGKASTTPTCSPLPDDARLLVLVAGLTGGSHARWVGTGCLVYCV